jgi:hypothetical protein
MWKWPGPLRGPAYKENTLKVLTRKGVPSVTSQHFQVAQSVMAVRCGNLLRYLHLVQICLLGYTAVRTSETSVDNHFTRQYIPEDNSEHHTRHRENLKSHTLTSLSTK